MSDENTIVDFRDLLSQPASNFPDLPELPAQKHFFGKILGISAGHSSQKKTPLFHVSARLTDPGKDVEKETLDKIANAGFSLSDYEVGADFYLTPNAMKMFRRFTESLGFNPNVSFMESLKLAQDGNPTNETQELLRGMDVMIQTPAPADNGRVYAQNGCAISGVKR